MIVLCYTHGSTEGNVRLKHHDRWNGGNGIVYFLVKITVTQQVRNGTPVKVIVLDANVPAVAPDTGAALVTQQPPSRKCHLYAMLLR